MRRRSLLVALALATSVSAANAAPPKKAPVAARAPKARAAAKPPAHAAEHGPPAAAAPPDDASPYAAAAAPAPAAPVVAAPAEGAPLAPASGDAKLDEPPPKTTVAEGPRVSPLNPAPPESPKSAPGPGPADLDRLIADIATLRARVAALTTSLFSSKLRVYVHTAGDDARVQAFVVTLDDGVVFRADPGFMADDEKVVYEHAVAPGSHVVGIEIERQDARGATFRTWQTTRFAIQVPERKVLEAIVVVEDHSDMADDFPDDQDGKYKLAVRLRAKVAE
jgi:hypothetical protein